MLSFECIKNEKSVYFLLTSASEQKRDSVWAEITSRNIYAQAGSLFRKNMT